MPDHEKPVRVALIGYGFAGQTFHAPLIRSVPGLQLAIVVSSNPERVRKDIPEAIVEPRLERALAHDDIDLVVVATPNQTHVPFATAILEAGKHLTVDKPFTTTLAEATFSRETRRGPRAHSLRLSESKVGQRLSRGESNPSGWRPRRRRAFRIPHRPLPPGCAASLERAERPRRGPMVRPWPSSG